MKKLKVVVVSLFDGLSGGRIAFDRVDHIEVLRYYSSEVDKYAIQVADKNYPQDIPYRLGDITKVDGRKLLKEIRAEFGEIKIIMIGGSPCQGFSMAGKLKGSSSACGIDVTSLSQYLHLKRENFDFSGQSYLFWEFVRLKKEIKPDYFMLENVKVNAKWIQMFNSEMAVKPHRINSKLVSPALRDRYYWTNIPNVTIPADKGMLLKEILEDGVETYKDKAYALTLANHSGNVRDFFTKSQSNIVFFKDDNGRITVKDNFAYFVLHKSKNPEKVHKIKCRLKDGTYSHRQLTVCESEKAMNLPVGYTSVVSATQAKNMIGNGWTIDVPAHIFRSIK